MTSSLHETYMQRCFYLARLGLGKAAPNPLVGSVVVYNNKIIGEGYHEQYGAAHAEVNAIKSVKNKSLLKDATIYVNLEPCAHYGKTPPCANLIVETGIPRVVIGCIDSYSEVSGKGIEKLKQAGIDVTVGVLEKEALQLNKRFFTFHNLKRPYIILKWAQSPDGFIDINRTDSKKGIHWITQPETKAMVHQWRAQEAGIVVGRKTVKNDNPQLNCRAYKGTSPLRVVLDPELSLNMANYKLGTDGEDTIVLNTINNNVNDKLQFVKIDEYSLENILIKLHELNLQSVIIEGGKFTLEKFISKDLWDEARILTGTSPLSSGTKAPVINSGLKSIKYFGKDLVTTLFNQSN